MGGVVLPLCQLPGLWQPSPGVYELCVGLMATSKRTYAKRRFPGLLPVPSSLRKPLLTHTSTGDPPTLAGSCDSVSCGVTAPFLWVLVCARFGLCPPRLESLFPLVLWKSCNQIPLTFKVRFPEDSQSLCPVPRLGSLTWGSEPSPQCKNFFGIIVLQFVGHPQLDTTREKPTHHTKISCVQQLRPNAARQINKLRSYYPCHSFNFLQYKLIYLVLLLI